MISETQKQIKQLENELAEIEGDISEAQKKLNATIEGKQAKINERLNSKDEKVREKQQLIFQLEHEERLRSERELVFNEIKNNKNEDSDIHCPLCINPSRLLGHDRNTNIPLYEYRPPILIKMKKLKDGALQCPFCKLKIESHLQF